MKGKTENEQGKDHISVKYSDIVKNEEVRALIAKGNEKPGMLGYTDHSELHGAIVNGNCALEAGLDIADAIATEPPLRLFPPPCICINHPARCG